MFSVPMNTSVSSGRCFKTGGLRRNQGTLTPRCCQDWARCGVFQMIPMVLGLGRVEVENYQGSPLHCGCVFWGSVRHCFCEVAKRAGSLKSCLRKRRQHGDSVWHHCWGHTMGTGAWVVRNGCEHRFGVVCGREGWVPQGFGLGVGLC